MGVQRKTAQVNWIASFGLIILAGTLYRLRKINNVIFKAQISEIMQKIGHKLNWQTQKSIIRTQHKMIKGQWEEMKLRSNKYKFYNKIYQVICSSEKLFNYGKKSK